MEGWQSRLANCVLSPLISEFALAILKSQNGKKLGECGSIELFYCRVVEEVALVDPTKTVTVVDVRFRYHKPQDLV